MTRKRVLFLIGRAPGLGAITHEVIDALLVIAAFDQDVGVLFTGDGVLQLLPSASANGDPRNHAKALGALATYDVTRIYVDATSLGLRQLSQDALALSPQILDASAISSLIANHDVVIPG